MKSQCNKQSKLQKKQFLAGTPPLGVFGDTWAAKCFSGTSSAIVKKNPEKNKNYFDF